ncbi:LacI family transcriptional regulator [Plantibacter sp. RU18]
MVDVAKLAGVSHVTVSRVLNNRELVRPETRKRVEDAIAELGYRRNEIARELKSRKSLTIGVVLAGAQLFELPHTLFGVETTAREAGYGLNLASWQGIAGDSLAETVDRMGDRAVQGVLIIADRPVVVAELPSLRPRVPTTMMLSGQVEGTEGLGYVEYDHVYGARLAVRHLLDLGHRSVAHITGNLDTFDANARLLGWQEELRSHGITDTERYEGDFQATSGYRWGSFLATRPEGPPTAVFAANDQIAMGALAAFAQHHVRVPEDVSLVGYDDQAGVEFTVPALTTVRQDFTRLGTESIRDVLDRIDGGDAKVTKLLPELKIRRSTSTPRR